MSGPRKFSIARGGALHEMDPNELDWDPRGIVEIWEPPERSATYVMGVDPTLGIVNWDRTLRTEDDYRCDNGAIQVVRVGSRGKPDVQVAQFAAPIHPHELADYANALGRLYAGGSEDGQCLCIVEIWPGPGWNTQERLIHDFGYTNLWRPRYINTLVPQSPRNVIGFSAQGNRVRDLWVRCSRHIIKGGVEIRSEDLVNEFADCEMDPNKMYAKANSGNHDDRVRAFMLAIYAAHDWDLSVETIKQEVTEGSAPDWQASDCTVEEMHDAWEDKFAEMQGG